MVPVVAASVDRLEQVPARLRFLFDYSAERALASDQARAEAQQSAAVIRALAEELATAPPMLDRDAFRAMATRVRARTGQKGKALFHPIRLVLTGEPEGLELDVAVPAIEHGALLAPAGSDSGRSPARAPGRRKWLRRWANDVVVFGIHPVLEALRARRVAALRVADKDSARHREILDLAQSEGVPVHRESAERLESRARGRVHQGVVAELVDAQSYGVADLVKDAAAAPLIVVLDGIEDPHNLGAILRTADAAGVDGVVVQNRRSAARSGVTAKASAGALAHVRLAEVVNIARALEELKELGLWTVGLAADAPKTYDGLDLTGPTALVFGAEGAGLRRLVRDRCDFLASIPMAGQVGSLNVSVAAGVALFEAVRQRRLARAAP